MMRDRSSKATARLSKYNFLSQAFSQMRTSYGGHINNREFEEEHQPVAVPVAVSAAPENQNGDRSYHDSMVLSSYDNSNNAAANSSTIPALPTTIPTTPTTPTTAALVGNRPRQQVQPKKYQMYSMYNNSTTSNALAPLPQHLSPGASGFFDNSNRESTVTVGTLHAPLFLSQHHQNPTPSSSTSIPSTPLPSPPLPPLSSQQQQKRGVYTPNLALLDGTESIVSDVSQYSNTVPSPLRQQQQMSTPVSYRQETPTRQQQQSPMMTVTRQDTPTGHHPLNTNNTTNATATSNNNSSANKPYPFF